MPIEFRCEHCNKLLRTADDKAGLSAQCPGCSANLIVPYPQAPVQDDLELELEIEESRPTRRRKKCPMCGAPVQGGNDRCRNCGELLDVEEDQWYVTSDPRHEQEHRGVILMVGAIFSWFCLGLILAIPVWIMADKDLKSMKAGTMDPEGEGLTRGAKIIAICNVVLSALIFLFVCCLGIIGSLNQN
ncbi:MAG: hypothetical protein KDA65_18940 [Planctomycetaceae bacterium]|nr:hypothetical protein [Planctomycetaceae bacterium]